MLVGHGVVPPEEACSDKVCHHHIYSVVVMGQEDTEYSHSTQHPADPGVPPVPLGGVCKTHRQHINLDWVAKTKKNPQFINLF